MMNLSRLARGLGKAAVYTRDLNAVRRGRIGERIVNRIVGRVVSRAMGKVWR